MHSKFMIYTNAVIVIYNLFLTSTFFSAKLYQGKRTKKERSWNKPQVFLPFS